MTSSERYDLMKGFVTAFSDLFMGVSRPEYSPRAQIENLEGRSVRVARIGVEQAFNDCMEMSQDLDDSDIERLNRRLEELRLPAFSDLQHVFSRKYAAVIKRGRIRTETEFYLLRNVMDSEQMPEPERGKIAQMLHEYEFRRKPA